MPTLSFFYGVAIRMFFDDHPPPHFHTVRGRDVAQVAIATGEPIRGRLSKADARRVKRWTELHRAELMANWTLATSGEDVELRRITGLDQDDG